MTQNRLRQVLGLGFGLAVIIGNTIGAGILRTPGEVAAHLPGVYWLMLVWIIGGLYALLGAFSIAELGAMLPQSGGQYVYAKRALGNYAGFVVGWSDWLSTCGTVALVAIVIGEYASAFWSVLAGRASSIAVIVVLFFAALQWRGINWGSGAQNLTSLLKALAFVANYALSFVDYDKFLAARGTSWPSSPTMRFRSFPSLFCGAQKRLQRAPIVRGATLSPPDWPWWGHLLFWSAQ